MNESNLNPNTNSITNSAPQLQTSENLNELFSALSCLQGKLDPVAKKSKGYNYNYAELSDCWKAVHKLLADNNLSISQFPAGQGIISILGHSSGQWMKAYTPMPNKDPRDPQKVGSSITYARRYALMAILGLPSEDDDGVKARTAPPKNTTNTNRTTAAVSKPAAKKQYDKPYDATGDSRPVTEAQIRYLHTVMTKNGYIKDEITAYIAKSWGISSTKKLTREQHQSLVQNIEANPKNAAHPVDAQYADRQAKDPTPTPADEPPPMSDDEIPF